jgi:hypothetical protein
MLPLLALALSTGRADASLVFNFDFTITGATPDGSPPWMRATFTDFGTYVELKIENLLQDDDEFCRVMGFNLDPALDPDELSFEYVSGQAAEDIDTGRSFDKIDGDAGGWFDIVLEYEGAANDERFTPGEVSVYKITSTEDIDEFSFDFQSSDKKDEDSEPFHQYAIAHIQGIADDPGSGHIGASHVPAPTSTLLTGIGIGLLTLFLKRRA